MWVAFALQKLLTFFSKKLQHICVSLDVNFNESLTNDIISFEQLGLGVQKYDNGSGFLFHWLTISMNCNNLQMKIDSHGELCKWA